jgi:hypothetical protein
LKIAYAFEQATKARRPPKFLEGVVMSSASENVEDQH